MSKRYVEVICNTETKYPRHDAWHTTGDFLTLSQLIDKEGLREKIKDILDKNIFMDYDKYENETEHGTDVQYEIRGIVTIFNKRLRKY